VPDTRQRILDAIELFERKLASVTTLQVIMRDLSELDPQTAEQVEALREELEMVYLKYEPAEQHFQAVAVLRRLRLELGG
jgi:hypothetical protein